jgi:hypothetical protein
MFEDVGRCQIHQRTTVGVEQRFAAELLQRHRPFLDEQENAALAHVSGDMPAPAAGDLVVGDHVRQVEIVEQAMRDLALEFRHAANLHVHRGV